MTNKYAAVADIFVSVSLIIMALTLSGCVTTKALLPEQCRSTDWGKTGYNDGVSGRSGAYFGKYINDCSSVSDVFPQRKLWEQGRQEGLKQFCTELNAYKLGREGSAWQPVCPIEGIEKLEEAYSQGRYYYLRQRDMEYLTTPYPFYYPNRYRYTPYIRPIW